MNDGDNVQKVLNCGWEGCQTKPFNYSDRHAQTASLSLVENTQNKAFVTSPIVTHPLTMSDLKTSLESVLGSGLRVGLVVGQIAGQWEEGGQIKAESRKESPKQGVQMKKTGCQG